LYAPILLPFLPALTLTNLPQQASISSSVAKILPTSSSVQSWSPALGRTYQTPTTTYSAAPKQREATSLPETTTTKPATTTTPPTARLLEEALGIHHQFGSHNLNENPITGKPGDFQLSSTGRKGVNLSAAAAANAKKAALVPTLPILNTKVGGVAGAENPLAAGKPTGKETKSPKTPGGGSFAKAKKRKGSKAAVTPQ
jgi:mediator of RNA polymerase II transcription subunit 6